MAQLSFRLHKNNAALQFLTSTLREMGCDIAVHQPDAFQVTHEALLCGPLIASRWLELLWVYYFCGCTECNEWKICISFAILVITVVCPRKKRSCRERLWAQRVLSCPVSCSVFCASRTARSSPPSAISVHRSEIHGPFCPNPISNPFSLGAGIGCNPFLPSMPIRRQEVLAVPKACLRKRVSNPRAAY